MEIVTNSSFFGVFLSLGAYLFGLWLQNRFKKAIFNPIMISVALTIAVLSCLKIGYIEYELSAKYLNYLLTPTTICLAIPLYRRLELLKRHFAAIMAGIASGVVTSMGLVWLLSKAFGLDRQMYITLLPKSITTAIGMGISEEYGGIVTITVAIIIITGVLGNMIASSVCKVMRIHDPVAKGLAIGTASHAIGTSRAMEMGETEGAMSGLSIAVAGLLTVAAAPFFAGLL